MAARFSRQIGPLLQKVEIFIQDHNEYTDVFGSARTWQRKRETSCYLFLGAQHTTARNPAVSYASPRLVQEFQRGADEIANLFNETSSRLIKARRKDVLVCEEQLAAALKDRATIEEQYKAAKETIAGFQELFERLGAQSSVRPVEVGTLENPGVGNHRKT